MLPRSPKIERSSFPEVLSHRPFVTILTFHSVAWWPLLALKGGRFWDDWTFYNTPFSHVWAHFSEVGFPWVAIILAGLAQTPLLFGPVALLLLATAGWLLFLILRKTPGWGPQLALWSSVVASVSPLYLARFSWIQLYAIVGLVFFLLAWAVGVAGSNSRLVLRLGLFASAIFVALALYAAFLTMLLALFAHLIWVSAFKSATTSRADAWKFIVTGVAVAILWLGIRTLFFRPYGTYEGYLQVVWGRGVFAAIFLVLILGLVVAFFARIEAPAPDNLRANAFVMTIAFALLVFLVAVVPYAAVGRLPPFWGGWHSRYEVNLFISLAFFVGGVAILLRQHMTQRTLRLYASAVVAFSLLVSNFAGVRFLNHWGKVSSIVALVSSEEVGGLIPEKVIFVLDRTTDQNAFVREPFRDYEWTGIISSGTNKSSTFATGVSSVSEAGDLYANYLTSGEDLISRIYDFHWRDHQVESPALVMTVFPSTFSCLEYHFSGQNPCVGISLTELLPDD